MESVCVLTRIAFLDEKHLVDKTILALFWNTKLAFFEEVCISMGSRKVFTDGRVFMYNNSLRRRRAVKPTLYESHRSHVKE